MSLKRVIRGEKNVRRTDRDGDRGKKETHRNKERERESNIAGKYVYCIPILNRIL